jgi:hypothetical protein
MISIARLPKRVPGEQALRTMNESNQASLLALESISAPQLSEVCILTVIDELATGGVSPVTLTPTSQNGDSKVKSAIDAKTRGIRNPGCASDVERPREDQETFQAQAGGQQRLEAMPTVVSRDGP